MPELQTLIVVLSAGGLAAVGLVLFFILRPRPAGLASQALARGDFAGATAAGREAESRAELLAAAIGAKHTLDYDLAIELVDRLLAADRNDGEAWLERGSAAAYRGATDVAEEAFSRVGASRSDLLEPLTLHRAWLALDSGDQAAARRLFEEVEAPLENKLRLDLGAGDPPFAEWFLQAAALWRAAGDRRRADWAERQGRAAAAGSRLPDRILGTTGPHPG